jgi:hypothetical protein
MKKKMNKSTYMRYDASNVDNSGELNNMKSSANLLVLESRIIFFVAPSGVIPCSVLLNHSQVADHFANIGSLFMCVCTRSKTVYLSAILASGYVQFLTIPFKTLKYLSVGYIHLEYTGPHKNISGAK